MGAEQAGIGAAICAASEALTTEELHERVFPLLLGVSGAHCALLYRFDEHGVRGVAGNLREAMPIYTPEMFAGDPVQQALLASPELKGLVATTQMKHLDRGALRRSLAWSAFYRPLQMDHLLGLPLTSGLRYGEPGMSGILFAAREDEGFSEEAQRRLATVAPALSAAARRVARFEAERGQRQAVEAVLAREVAAPHLALDLRARLVWASARARDLLRLDDGLPEPLRAAAARLGALALDAQSSSVAGLRFELALPGPLRVLLSLARGPSGQLFVDVAVDEPAASLGGLAARHGLTPAETRTLAVLALGETNREIARRLGVSIETVRTHVRRVLDKLSVRSRQEAARLARAEGATAPAPAPASRGRAAAVQANAGPAQFLRGGARPPQH